MAQKRGMGFVGHAMTPTAKMRNDGVLTTKGNYLESVVEPRPILGGYQPVPEDPALLMAPQPQDLVLRVGVVGLDHQKTLENLRHEKFQAKSEGGFCHVSHTTEMSSPSCRSNTLMSSLE